VIDALAGHKRLPVMDSGTRAHLPGIMRSLADRRYRVAFRVAGARPMADMANEA
jgi:hypothetical protein